MTNVIVPTYFTELMAVNYVLGAIGEQPLTTLSGATQADVAMILNILTNVTAEVLALWQFGFNTEIGYQLQPAGQIQWSNPSQGNVETLNVFAIPPTMAAYRINPSYAQSGINYVDLGFRRAAVFNVASVYPIVFYDRAKNREGWNAQAYPFLALDVGWFWQFTDLPFAMQQYICAKAARQAAERIVNAGELASFVKTDEAWSYRAAMRQFGYKDSVNALRTVNGFRAMGNRPTTNVGFIDIRGLAPAQTETILPTVSCTVSSGAVSQPRNASYSFTFTVTNPNTMSVSVQLAATVGSGTVAFGTPASAFSSAEIPALGTLQVPCTYTLSNSAGAGAFDLSVSTFTIGDPTNISPINNGVLSITST